MTQTKDSSVYISRRDPALKVGFAIFMAVAIAALGWVMMTVSSSPTVKGASFLWLPAALQLVAGIWLGPVYGTLAGGIGAYAAGNLAYGGWGLVDIIQNPIAGGLANALLPWVLFRALRIAPTMGASRPADVLSGAVRALILTALVLLSGMLAPLLGIPGAWGYLIPLVVLLVGARLLLSNLSLNMRDFGLGLLVAFIICVVSAFIGAIGAALTDPGVGWFAGDLVSAILGLYLLPLYTTRLRNAGIAE